MIPWTNIVHIGDGTVMIPAAAGIMIYLITGRAWRMAWWWCLLFTLDIGLVLTTKIAFLGWGAGIRSLDFKALSGHAASATAVIPVIFYLLLQRSSFIARACGVLLGIVLGVLMGVLLVALNEHTVSEVTAGCLIGGIICLTFIWISEPLPSFNLSAWFLPLGVLALIAVHYVEPPPVGYWMMRIALYLSGHKQPYSWATWELDT